MALLSIVLSVLTGERINFLIRACGGMLASISWKPKLWRVLLIVGIEITAVVVVFHIRPELGHRYVGNFVENLPTTTESAYFRAAAPGILAFDKEPVLGVGPGNLRYLCEEVSAGFRAYDCHPHPHNYYIQLLGETGVVGFAFGVLFILSNLVLRTSSPSKPPQRRRSHCGLCHLASSGQLHRQLTSSYWNNVFMWSAIAVALAGARIGSSKNATLKD